MLSRTLILMFKYPYPKQNVDDKGTSGDSRETIRHHSVELW